MLFLNNLLLFLIIFCSIFVIFSRNTVHAVYFLILVYCFSACLFLLLGAEFLAILLIIIYVGALSMLFLFVIMLLNLRITELHSTSVTYSPIGIFVGVFFFFFLFYFMLNDFSFYFVETPEFNNSYRYNYYSAATYHGQIAFLGFLLYNYYGYLVMMAAIILLLAMIGVIMLTVDRDFQAIKQDISDQDRIEDTHFISMWSINKKK